MGLVYVSKSIPVLENVYGVYSCGRLLYYRSRIMCKKPSTNSPKETKEALYYRSRIMCKKPSTNSPKETKEAWRKAGIQKYFTHEGDDVSFHVLVSYIYDTETQGGSMPNDLALCSFEGFA